MPPKWTLTRPSMIIMMVATFAAIISIYFYPYTFTILFINLTVTLIFVHIANPVVDRQMTSYQTARMLFVLLAANDLFTLALTDIARRDFAYPIVKGIVEFVMNASVADAYRCDQVVSAMGCIEYHAFIGPTLLAPFIFITIFFRKFSSMVSHALMDSKYPTGWRRLSCLVFVTIFIYIVYLAYYDNVISPTSDSLHPVVDMAYAFIKSRDAVFLSTVTIWSSTAIVLPVFIVIVFESFARLRLQDRGDK